MLRIISFKDKIQKPTNFGKGKMGLLATHGNQAIEKIFMISKLRIFFTEIFK